ncbi:unnamed protein product [Paramecium sonneborni]|uniref:Uncharacterized protein n=1 Tax=Paramecium sonneborni TaxID=65129 RepID=A0A8S1MQG4_9CILI|nr:unnamed protein product [Paramecium sonneborni]
MLNRMAAIFESKVFFQLRKIKIKITYNLIQFYKKFNYIIYTDLINFACKNFKKQYKYHFSYYLKLDTKTRFSKLKHYNQSRSLQQMPLVNQIFNYPTQTFEIYYKPLLKFFDLLQKINSNIQASLQPFLLQQKSRQQISDFQRSIISAICGCNRINSYKLKIQFN